MIERNITYQVHGDWGTYWMIHEATGILPSSVRRQVEFQVTTNTEEPARGRTSYHLKGPDDATLPGEYVVESVENRKDKTVIRMLRAIEEAEDGNK